MRTRSWCHFAYIFVRILMDFVKVCVYGKNMQLVFILNKSSLRYLGTHIELSCLPGTYQPNLGQGNCIPCGPGSMCPYQNMSSVEPCMAGYYCPNGTQQACPAGTYGNRSGLSSIDMCTDCPSGVFCQVMLNLSKALTLIDYLSFTPNSL